METAWLETPILHLDAGAFFASVEQYGESRYRDFVVRLIGVGLHQLHHERQIDLFETGEDERKHRLSRALDQLRGKYGTEII